MAVWVVRDLEIADVSPWDATQQGSMLRLWLLQGMVTGPQLAESCGASLAARFFKIERLDCAVDS